jgi:chorismate mutase
MRGIDKKSERRFIMISIEKLREKIEHTDASIIKKLAQRDALSKRIGQIKLKAGTEVIDVSREKKLFELYSRLCEEYHLPQKFILRLFKTIINHSRQVQK